MEEEKLVTKPVKTKQNKRTAPGNRLTQCKASLNTRLLTLKQYHQIPSPPPIITAIHQPPLLIYIPHIIPLQEILSVCNSHLSQVSLMPALREWVNQELILEHIHKDYFQPNQTNSTSIDITTLQWRDLQNIKQESEITCNQDALENFLNHEI